MKSLKRIAPVILLCGLLFALAACAEDNLAAGLPMLEGRPVSQAVHYLGPPTEENKISGETAYSWVSNQSGSFYVPETASYPVVVQNGGHPTMAFTQPNTPPMPDTYNWHCRIDIIADNNVIVHTHYQGDGAGCKIFSDKLKPLADVADKKKTTP